MHCDLLVIVAGPYGIATAAYAKSRGLDVVVCDRFMEFWKRSMPDGMFLRSDERWHLDAEERHTFQAFVNEAGFSREPLFAFKIEKICPRFLETIPSAAQPSGGLRANDPAQCPVSP